MPVIIAGYKNPLPVNESFSVKIGDDDESALTREDEMADLSTTYMGIPLKNPFIVAKNPGRGSKMR